jgi:hypothetical protein
MNLDGVAYYFVDSLLNDLVYGRLPLRGLLKPYHRESVHVCVKHQCAYFAVLAPPARPA